MLLLSSLKVTAVAQVASLRSSAFRVCSAFMVWAWVRSPRQQRKMLPAHCVPFFICFGFFPSALGTSSKICSCATSDSWTTPLATDLFFCRCPLRGSPHCTCFMLCLRWLCGPAAALFLLSRARGVVYSRGCTTSRTVEVHFAVVPLSLCFMQQAATHFFEQPVPSTVYMFGANLTSGLFVDCVLSELWILLDSRASAPAISTAFRSPL